MLHDSRQTTDLGKVLFVKTGEHTSVIYGTHYPNRLFVGCLPPEAGAEDLGSFFSTFGNVVEAKVVLDQQGRSKRFGFVTFSNPEDVESLISGREIYFQGKKINVGPAVKKNLDSETAPKPIPPKPAASKPPLNVVAAQHVPKTIIRRSPTECQPMTFDQQPNGDGSFRSIWGITSQANSIWAPLGDEKPPQFPMQTQEKSFSFFRQMQENNNHSNNNLSGYYGNSAPIASSNSYSNIVRAPPGFNQPPVLFSQK